MRTVNIDYNPTYFAKEEQYQAKLYQNFGNIALNVTGGYAANSVESTTDYIQSVQRSLAGNPGLMNLAGAAALGGPSSPFAPIVAALMPRSEEHTSELQSLMRISYAVFCLKKKN